MQMMFWVGLWHSFTLPELWEHCPPEGLPSEALVLGGGLLGDLERQAGRERVEGREGDRARAQTGRDRDGSASEERCLRLVRGPLLPHFHGFLSLPPTLLFGWKS